MVIDSDRIGGIPRRPHVTTIAWGVAVSLVELKDIQLPETMKRAMAKQAEAEREKRAKIISAEGESMAAALSATTPHGAPQPNGAPQPAATTVVDPPAPPPTT